MGTRSRIGVQNADGTITSIYCHWDGYPEAPGVGAKLVAHYATEEHARALLALGDISALGEKLHPAAGVAHTFDAPAEGVTLPYSLRGEDVPAQKSAGDDAFRELTKECWGQYAYLLTTSGKWLCWAVPSGKLQALPT